MKQRALAKKLSVSANYLSLVENSKREPSISFLRKLARELDVPVGIFLMWQELNPMKPGGPEMDQVRNLLTRLETMYVLNTGRRRRKA